MVNPSSNKDYLMPNTNLKEAAELHSATCFLNSLLREWNDFQVVKASPHDQIIIKMDNDEKLKIRLKRFSELGRHHYTGVYFLTTTDSEKQIGFHELVETLSQFLADKFKTNLRKLNLFKQRVFASNETILSSLERRLPQIQTLDQTALSFADTEQGLFVGHSFHPTPKSRDEFSTEDMRLYSPEYAGEFNLDWYAADPYVIFQKSASCFKDVKWTETLAKADLENSTLLSAALNRGLIAIPMHPWQMNVLKKNPTIQKYLSSEKLVYLGASTKKWKPTSSLRSIYREGAPYMLKFSMSIKLTNSIRHLLIHEVDRGLQLSDVLATPTGKKLLSENHKLKIVNETAYFCFQDESGKPLEESIVVCRENPFQGDNAFGKSVLATLTQDAPMGDKNLIQKLILSQGSSDLHQKAKDWFKKYLDVAVKPLVKAQSQYGVILGAHQQNLILDIKDGYPIQAYFRDCQGTGYSELGFKNFAHLVSSINRDNGNVVSEKMGNYLFAYYLILNSTFNVISALCSQNWITELELLAELKNVLVEIKDTNPEDSSCLDYLLTQPTLMHKGNFICAFQSLNENTTVDPLVIYTPVTNPLPHLNLHQKGEAMLNDTFCVTHPAGETWTVTHGRKHPVRPLMKPGLQYRRFVPEINKTVSVRTVEIEKDLDLFHNWHNQPRVYDLWDLNKSKEELRTYLEQGLADLHQIPMIVEFDEKPIGYFEVYWVAEDRLAPYYDYASYDRGFHFLIGDRRSLGSENTKAAVTSVMHMMFLNEPRTQRILAEPRSDNKLVLKYVELIPGWKFIKEFDFPHKRAALLMADRTTFLTGNNL